MWNKAGESGTKKGLEFKRKSGFKGLYFSCLLNFKNCLINEMEICNI